jgi:cell division protein FtsW
VLGCVFSYSFSSPVAQRIGVDSYYFFKRHISFSIVSLILLLSLAHLSIGTIRAASLPLFYSSLFLLALVPFFGLPIKGARRWLYIAGLSLQPSEFLKPSLILFFAHFLDKFSKNNDPKTLLAPAVLIFITSLLIFRQPDIGTFLLLSLVLSSQILLLDSLGLVHCLYLLAVFAVLSATAYLTFPHVSGRIANFLAGIRDMGRAHYQVRESVLAYQNASWLGRGFLEGEIKNHIPDSHTDFIFPAITEEFGFIIALLLVLIYFHIATRTMLKAKRRKDTYEFLAISGLSLLLILQTSLNLGVSMNLLPTKGITLPFLSYGGSSLLGASMIAGCMLVFTKKEFGIKNYENYGQTH